MNTLSTLEITIMSIASGTVVLLIVYGFAIYLLHEMITDAFIFNPRYISFNDGNPMKQGKQSRHDAHGQVEVEHDDIMHEDYCPPNECTVCEERRFIGEQAQFDIDNNPDDGSWVGR